MLIKLNHLRIGTKLFGVLLLATVAIVGSSAYLMQTLQTTSEKLEKELYDELYYATFYLLNADRDFYQAEQAFMSMQASSAMTGEQQAAWTADFQENAAQVVERMNLAKGILSEVEGLPMEQVLANFDSFFEQYNTWREDVIQLISDQTQVTAVQLEQLQHDFNQTRNEIDVLQQDLEQSAITKIQAIHDANQKQMIFAWVLIALVLIIVFTLGFVLIRSITKPVAKLVHHMHEIASGNLRLNLDTAETERRDEIGQLARSSEAMLHYLRSMVQKMQQISDHVDQQSQVLAQAASDVRSGSDQVAATMQQLSAGAEEQAGSSSEISSLIDHLNRQIEQSNADGIAMENIANEVNEAAGQGQVEMQRSVELFGDVTTLVESSSEQVKRLELRIGDISQLSVAIKGIAEQTNLLALNAAIEAARAGEAGKGFAVVADQVRKLSEQVNDSVEEITGIIHGIQGETQSMVQAMEEGRGKVTSGNEQIQVSHGHFMKINTSVTSLMERIHSVSANLIQITENSDKVSRATTDIAAASEEAAAGVEQCAATAEEQSSATHEVANHADQLKQHASELQELVKQFKY